MDSLADKAECSGFYLGDTPVEEITPGERDALARRILTSLYEIAAMEKGLEIISIEVHKKGEEPEMN